MRSGFYVKYELTREALKSFAELADLARREAATRVSVISCAPTIAQLESEDLPRLEPGLQYAAIKAPTIDGTEIWLVESRIQAEFESAVGFGKTSVPLLLIGTPALKGLAFRHPLQEAEGSVASEELAVRAMKEAGTYILRSEAGANP